MAVPVGVCVLVCMHVCMHFLGKWGPVMRTFVLFFFVVVLLL